MPAGEEVTISYISPLPGLEERQAGFERTWEFECDCELCRADAVDDYVTRERMMDEEWPGLAKIASTAVQAVGLKGLNGSGKKSKSSQSAASAKVVKALKDFANRLVGTYGKTRRIKLELATVYGLLANLSREDRPVCVKVGVLTREYPCIILSVISLASIRYSSAASSWQRYKKLKRPAKRSRSSVT